ncbi:hypothetical protein [Gorillibacterium sp. sgz5001074]|uniref:hypothetical protein n=1 Tax=Gorillibacterium sp. sgz5001074 TaxID=3446695 RepID=UPI003F669DF2
MNPYVGMSEDNLTNLLKLKRTMISTLKEEVRQIEEALKMKNSPSRGRSPESCSKEKY